MACPRTNDQLFHFLLGQYDTRPYLGRANRFHFK